MAETPVAGSSSRPQSKRKPPAAEETNLPLHDPNAYYYPSIFENSDSDETNLPAGTKGGNWGHKTTRGARWVRRGKITAWGPAMDEWEAEDRARKRIRLMLPQEPRSPSPPSLPHLRAPSPPITAPYPPPTSQHLSYTEFVLDKSITHSFRSNLLDDLESATNGLIEEEGEMMQALGRLWQVMSEDPSRRHGSTASLVLKREEDVDGMAPGDHMDPVDVRIARAPDPTPAVHKHFLSPFQHEDTTVQRETMEKSLATLRELADDGREYVERLEEIREGLGDARSHRDVVWTMVRKNALKELQDITYD